MPLAVARWGICSRCSAAPLLACPPLCPQQARRRRHPVTAAAARKAASRHRLVAVNDYRLAAERSGAAAEISPSPGASPALARVCCCSAFCSVTICRQ
ncbi:hypothetical protein MJ561_27140 [Klebsiella pneumoniae]|nr:hypothetical protein MJ561_27140 [Klebsiella pneumoniae]